MEKFEVDFSEPTIYRIDGDGNRKDLNKHGTPIFDLEKLQDFADELYECGAFNKQVHISITNEIRSRLQYLQKVK